VGFRAHVKIASPIVSYNRVCLCVCLSVISPEPHVQTSPNFLYLLPVSVARSSLGGVAICYLFPVFVDDLLFSYNGPYGSMPIPLQRRPCSVLCRIALGPSCFISIFIYYKQQRANRPLTCCNIQQCIHDTVFELGLCKISFAIF